jgi:MerR family transcriptional regulator/heat shock protein HspR
MKKVLSEFTEDEKKDMPLYPIGVVAELIGITDQTIRLYEKHGLIKPARRNRNRFYSENDLKWLQCLRKLIHNKKISIEGIKKLLDYAPCWELTGCPEKERENCSAYMERTKPCWELNKSICQKGSSRACETCVVFLSKKIKKKS